MNAIASAGAPRAAAALSLAQLMAGLWHDDTSQVYAMIIGARVPNLPTRLAGAAVGDWDCLQPGELTPELERRATYLVTLRRRSPFTDWLLGKAAADFGEWGLLARSPAGFLAVRSHLRSLASVRLPDGSDLEWPWADPTVLRTLLPLFSAAQNEQYFGPLRSLVIPAVAEWTTLAVQLGRLEMAVTAVAAG